MPMYLIDRAIACSIIVLMWCAKIALAIAWMVAKAVLGLGRLVFGLFQRKQIREEQQVVMQERD